MGHLGLTPQTATMLGGLKVQGKDIETAKKIYEDSLLLEKLGCFAIVLECVPAQLAKLITDTVSIPVIGIGAGKDCDGQVLVFHDLIGLLEGFRPKFVKQYLKLNEAITRALSEFKQEVQNGAFPSGEHSFNMKQEIFSQLLNEIKQKK
jgi:3-methyl-2-oxobutanoate hydroxymethyltransferase